MITLYGAAGGHLEKLDWTPGTALPEGIVWIDLLRPSPEEEEAVQKTVDLELPTRAELQEIEMSSRLYQEGAARYMAATIMSKAEQEHPEAEAMAFVVRPPLLVTLRYSEPHAFAHFALRAMRQPGLADGGGVTVFAGLLEAIVDRAADVLEQVTGDLDRLSREVFRKRRGPAEAGIDLEDAVRRLGLYEDRTTKVQDSLASIIRVVSFFSASMRGGTRKEFAARLKVVSRDARSIMEHASSLAMKGNFLLDATLGLINVEQTKTIKIFSVAAVVFLPPTLIASIYGMHFKVLPELDLGFGYPMALAMMLCSAVLPYLYFKRKGWL